MRIMASSAARLNTAFADPDIAARTTSGIAPPSASTAPKP